jgi:opacity protein-like surface antigen
MSFNNTLRAFSLGCCLLSTAASAVAEQAPELDEILLKNGSRILGTVTEARDGTLIIETEFAGTLEVDTAQVEALRTREPVTLLADDTVIRDEPLTVDEEQVVTPTDTYALEDVLVLNPEPWELGEGYKWTGLASFAFNIQRGNTDTDELDYKLETKWRSKRDRYTLKLNGEIDEANKQKNADNWRVIGKYDYFLSDHTYWGINAFAESDEFADLDLRWFIGPYIGREFFTDPLFEFSAEVGAAWVEEDFITAPDQEYPASNWSLNMSSNYLGGDSRLYLDQLGILRLDDLSDVIIKTSIGLAFPLLWNFEAAAEILWEYDSGAVAGVEKLDETYMMRVGYTW